MLFELLTETEKEMMLKYIDAYAGGRSEDQNSLDYILRYWEKNKQDLFKLLGNQLIYSVPYVGREPEERLILKVKDAMAGFGTNRAMSILDSKLYEAIHYPIGLVDGTPFTTQNHLRNDLSSLYNDLMNAKAIVENKYAGPTRKFTLNNGKVYQFQNGARTVKLIGKLCEILGIPQEDFEEFRLLQSQIVNQKNVNGTLCFSIHPLDFMTMSDNESRWTSCMSWNDTGCYRRGTVEMMNSPMVMVVYLKDNNTMAMPNTDAVWNNKKWRQLFIVDERAAVSIKAYPYANKDLSCKALEIINQLSSNYYNSTIYTFNDPNDVGINSINGDVRINNIKLRFDTNTMYNDFYTTNHYIMFKNGMDTDAPVNIYINYSGEEECMRCGCVNNEFNEEGDLICQECMHEFYCECCGNWYDEDESIEGPDGNLYCRYCYEDRFSYCELTGRDEVNDLPDMVYIVSDELKPMLESDYFTDERKAESLKDYPYFDFNMNEIAFDDILPEYLEKPGLYSVSYRTTRNWWNSYITYYYVYASQIGPKMYDVAYGGRLDGYTSNDELLSVIKETRNDD